MTTSDTAPINNFETNAGRPRAGRNPPRPEMAKRVMDVEEVLQWAFREELPKNDGLSGGRHGPPAYVSPLARMVASGGVNIDNWSREPGFPSAMGPPHADALLVAQALHDVAASGSRLDYFSSELQLMPDWPALGADEVEAMRIALASIEAIVGRCAKLRERPYWTKGTVPLPLRHTNGRLQVVREEVTVVVNPFGEEVERRTLVQAEVRRKGDYPEGSYSPLRYDPDPQSIASERAEWLAWWGALRAIAEALSGKLSTIAILPPGAPQRPWMGEEDLGMPPRVFEDLSSRVYQRQQRETAAAHRALGLRGSIGGRGAARMRGLPTRVVRRPSSVRERACNVV